ncbi:MAG: hypothetical protein AB7V23_14105 [Candidatus Nanopelagicales bacterium]
MTTPTIDAPAAAPGLGWPLAPERTSPSGLGWPEDAPTLPTHGPEAGT